jgi:hypothetical protein
MHMEMLSLDWPNAGSNSVVGKLTANASPILKSFTLTNGDIGSQIAVLGLLANATLPLEAISLQSMDFRTLEPLVDILCDHHAAELRNLSFYQSENE